LNSDKCLENENKLEKEFKVIHSINDQFNFKRQARISSHELAYKSSAKKSKCSFNEMNQLKAPTLYYQSDFRYIKHRKPGTLNHIKEMKNIY